LIEANQLSIFANAAVGAIENRKLIKFFGFKPFETVGGDCAIWHLLKTHGSLQIVTRKGNNFSLCKACGSGGCRGIQWICFCLRLSTGTEKEKKNSGPKFSNQENLLRDSLSYGATNEFTEALKIPLQLVQIRKEGPQSLLMPGDIPFGEIFGPHNIWRFQLQTVSDRKFRWDILVHSLWSH
jgi:hypothetical protein